jgi:hypothetical protein
MVESVFTGCRTVLSQAMRPVRDRIRSPKTRHWQDRKFLRGVI